VPSPISWPRSARDVGDWIDAKAKAEGRALNHVIINAMAEYPSLKRFRDFATLIGDMETVLARYGARIAAHDLADEMLNAIDAVLKAEGGSTLQAAVERMRVVSAAMLKSKA
jgi:hypothetical protein